MPSASDKPPAHKPSRRAQRSSGKEEQEDAEQAAAILRGYLAEHDVSLKELARLLGSKEGEDERTLSNKIQRGRFSFAFVVRVMKALGEESVDVVPRGQRRKSRGLLDL